MKSSADPSFNIIRMVFLFWLFGWIVKSPFFVRYLLGETWRFPLFNDFFPRVFESSLTSTVAYLLPIAFSVLLLKNKRGFFIVYAILITLCSMTLALHLNTCNDATFVTSTWTGLWLIVFAGHLERMTPAIYRHLKLSGLCVISLIFLGGTAGKLSREFLSGATIYGIFFENRIYWPHTWIRETLSPVGQKLLAQTAAGLIFAAEGFLMFAPVWSCAITLVLLSAATVFMVVFCTYNILSVIACLLGIAAACRRMEKLQLQK